MNINTNGITNAPLAPKPSPPAQPAAPQLPTEGLPSDASAYQPSPEWLRPLDQVRQQPEIRAERVASVVERLRTGYYATPAAATATAEAKLNSLD